MKNADTTPSPVTTNSTQAINLLMACFVKRGFSPSCLRLARCYHSQEAGWIS